MKKMARILILALVLVMVLSTTAALATGTAIGNPRILRAWLNPDGGDKPRVTVDMADIIFDEYVCLALIDYDRENGEPVAITFNKDNIIAEKWYPELTGAITLVGESSSWFNVYFDAYDGLVPDSVWLFIDGELVDTHDLILGGDEFSPEVMDQMTDKEWADFPGTLPGMPATGDSAQVMLWAAMTLAGVAALIVLARRRRVTE